jgi:peptidoglycan/xylan/chitin deacetylase (PgdA/CDA1 family)
VASDTLVLCYHAVSETWPAPLASTPAELRGQLSALVRRGYRGATFADAVAAAGRGDGGRTLAVTFDDAYRSTRELAEPILRELGLVGTVFVPTAYADRPEPMRWPGIDQWSGGPHEAELACMTADDLRALAAGGWEIGSHTVSHPRLSQLAGAELDRELEQSRARVAELVGAPCRSLAYPYGDYDDAVVAAARRAGYAAACTLEVGRHGGDPLRWPRVGIYRGEPGWRVALKCHPWTRGLSLAKLRHPIAARRAG